MISVFCGWDERSWLRAQAQTYLTWDLGDSMDTKEPKNWWSLVKTPLSDKLPNCLNSLKTSQKSQWHSLQEEKCSITASVSMCCWRLCVCQRNVLLCSRTRTDHPLTSCSWWSWFSIVICWGLIGEVNSAGLRPMFFAANCKSCAWTCLTQNTSLGAESLLKYLLVCVVSRFKTD